MKPNYHAIYQIVTSEEWEEHMVPFLESRLEKQLSLLISSENAEARTRIKTYKELLDLPEYCLVNVNQSKKGVDKNDHEN